MSNFGFRQWDDEQTAAECPSSQILFPRCLMKSTFSSDEKSVTKLDPLLGGHDEPTSNYLKGHVNSPSFLRSTAAQSQRWHLLKGQMICTFELFCLIFLCYKYSSCFFTVCCYLCSILIVDSIFIVIQYVHVLFLVISIWSSLFWHIGAIHCWGIIPWSSPQKGMVTWCFQAYPWRVKDLKPTN